LSQRWSPLGVETTVVSDSIGRDLAGLTAKLVAIDSVNPSLAKGAAGEAAIASFVATWLERAGLEVDVVDAGEGRPSVIGLARGGGAGTSLMLNAHLDTVGYGGMSDALTPRLEGRRLYGRGSYDMKGSLAACMVVGAVAVRERLRGDVIVTAVADEEYGSRGAHAVSRRVKPSAAIVTEPTGLDKLCVSHKGFAWGEITTRGRAAHGSRPDLGHDAIADMGCVLAAVKARSDAAAIQIDPLLGSRSLHCSLIEGGQELSSYPERCTLQLEWRTLPGETIESVETEVHDLLELCACDDFDASYRTLLWRDPFAISPDAALVAHVRGAAEAVTGHEPLLAGMSAWTDAAVFSSAGIPTVIYGPGGAGAHAAVEWVDLDDLQRCVDVYLHVARAVCR
jgi:acetylornithine deacetylase